MLIYLFPPKYPWNTRQPSKNTKGNFPENAILETIEALINLYQSTQHGVFTQERNAITPPIFSCADFVYLGSARHRLLLKLNS